MNHFVSNREPESEAPLGVIDDRTIGRILVDLGKLKRSDVDRVFDLHKRKGLRFGEAALKLRLVSVADVQYALSVQFGYPCLRPGEAALAAELVAAHHPHGAQGEALRDLRAQLLVRWFESGQKLLAVVSPQAGEGRSYIAANLAVSFSQWGANTLLIDADLRAPRQHRIFNLGNQTGLSRALSGRDWAAAIETIPHFGNLSVLPAGTIPPNPVELLGGSEFRRLLGEVTRQYEIILLDTAAGMRGADAQTVAGRAGGALLVARRDRSRIEEMQNLMDGLSGHGAQLVGAVLNEF